MIKTKNYIKKIFLLALILFHVVIVGGCDFNETLEGITLTIYTMNDFHGCLEEDGDMAGIYKIGDYLIKEKEASPETTLIISAGDMFQGTAVSSMTRGKAVVEVMNYIGFDAMTLGNHEFDWGIDEVLKYQDGNLDNGEADFPFLAANIINKNTNELITNPYTIIEKSGYKIGIIGIIGSDQTNDILASYVKDYEFSDELTAIKKYTKELREEKKCDVVILSAHLDTDNINKELSKLHDEYKIDAIINGHTHYEYYGELNYGERISPLPYVQSGSYGKYIGKIVLKLNGKTRSVEDGFASNLKASKVCKTENTQIKNIINSYSKELTAAKEELGISGATINKDQGAKWAANVIASFEDAEVGLINSGGIRKNGFPIEANSTITYGDIFEIMPFENMIKVVSIKGRDLKMIAGFLVVSDSLKITGDNVFINDNLVEDEEYYRVATIDFLYEKDNYPFKKGIDPVDTNVLFRDALASAVRDYMKSHDKFYIE